MLKTRFPFLYASTSLDAKTFVYKTLASNRNFESCMSIRCLASQHILQFFHFCRGCFLCIGNFAHHCVVLLNAPLSDRDKKKKKTCLQWVSFPGKSLSIVSDARRSRCPIGLRFQEARSPGVGQVVCEPLWAKISHLSLGGIQPLWAIL